METITTTETIYNEHGTISEMTELPIEFHQIRKKFKGNQKPKKRTEKIYLSLERQGEIDFYKSQKAMNDTEQTMC